MRRVSRGWAVEEKEEMKEAVEERRRRNRTRVGGGGVQRGDGKVRREAIVCGGTKTSGDGELPFLSLSLSLYLRVYDDRRVVPRLTAPRRAVRSP